MHAQSWLRSFWEMGCSFASLEMWPPGPVIQNKLAVQLLSRAKVLTEEESNLVEDHIVWTSYM